MSREDRNLPPNAFPISFKLIAKEQQKDSYLKKKKAQKHKKFCVKTFHGGEKDHLLDCYEHKIYVPKSLQSKLVEWYHIMLCHPGKTRTEERIRQRFHWSELRTEVHKHCKNYASCQMTKRVTQKYGHLPAKKVESTP